MTPTIKPYTGKSLEAKHVYTHNGEKKELAPYLPGESLVKAVQLAQILGRPLLLKGEPGCGKSRLAEAVAFELFGDAFPDYYFEWHVKSSSKAQDGLYMIDHLQRMSDANLKGDSGKDISIRLYKDELGNYQPTGKYIQLGELGKAFQKSGSMDPKKDKAPPVVLIDEIDKADIDFPNDLLLELDKMEFIIPEAVDDRQNAVFIKADKQFRPLIIITSNDEKPLPPAFLRRCLFHYIDFKEIKLAEIVRSNFSLPDDLVNSSIDAFKAWRKRIEEKQVSNKNISTSELLDWVRLIAHYHKQGKKKIAFDKAELPLFHQALLKDAESIKLFAHEKPAPITTP